MRSCRSRLNRWIRCAAMRWSCLTHGGCLSWPCPRRWALVTCKTEQEELRLLRTGVASHGHALFFFYGLRCCALESKLRVCRECLLLNALPAVHQGQKQESWEPVVFLQRGSLRVSFLRCTLALARTCICKWMHTQCVSAVVHL